MSGRRTRQSNRGRGVTRVQRVPEAVERHATLEGGLGGRVTCKKTREQANTVAGSSAAHVAGAIAAAGGAAGGMTTRRPLTGVERDREYRAKRYRGEVPDDRYGASPMTVAEYIDGGSFDSRRFGKCREQVGTAGSAMSVIIKGRKVLTRHALWDRRWKHASNSLKQWPAGGDCDMPWFRSASAGEYHRAMAPVVADIVAGRRYFSRDGDVLLLPARPMDALWFIEDQAGWWRDCLFESRNRRVTSANSTRSGQVFAGWHNLEVVGVRSVD